MWRERDHGGARGDDRSTEELVGALQSGSKVGGIAHCCIVETLLRADVSDQCIARVKADALAQLVAECPGEGIVTDCPILASLDAEGDL